MWHQHTIPYEHAVGRVLFENLFERPTEMHLMAMMNIAGLFHVAICTTKQDHKALHVALEQTNPPT